MSLKQHMHNAFERELLLIRPVIDMETHGVAIRDDVHYFLKHTKGQLCEAESKIYAVSDGHKPGTKAAFNALRKNGAIDESKIEYTPKGNPRYGRDQLPKIVTDKDVLEALVMRSKLVKIIGTYIQPFADAHNKYGRYYAYFNQVRSEKGGGTTTGRFSSNLQQMPKVPSDGMPNARTLICADKGEVLIKRDFDGQELRVAAHYAEGHILQAYINNPKLDPHTLVQQLIKDKCHKDVSRTEAKVMNFLKLYRGGAKLLASMLECDVKDARALYKAYDTALPEFERLMTDVEQHVKAGNKLRTWGGRLYDVEPPSLNNFGRMQHKYYKLGNILIQGSSADMTKEAINRYYYHPDRQGKLILTVHDELVVTVRESVVDDEMALLKWAMDEIPGWDVPLSSDAKIGYNFGEMQDYV